MIKFLENPRKYYKIQKKYSKRLQKSFTPLFLSHPNWIKRRLRKYKRNSTNIKKCCFKAEWRYDERKKTIKSS